MTKVLNSKIDRSVNYVYKTDKGSVESRYVNRNNGYSICYLSSHDGCNRGCKFCHLTELGQTSMRQCTIDDYRKQIDSVFESMSFDRTLKYRDNHIHFNFMARGEPLLNDNVIDGSVFHLIEEYSEKYDFSYDAIISTIFPKSFKHKELHHLFGGYRPIIYYSLYSTEYPFRSKWLPTANMNWRECLRMLEQYFSYTGIHSAVHFPLIKGQNDSIENMITMVDFFKQMCYTPSVNLIRYNPPNRHYVESSMSTINVWKDYINYHLSEKHLPVCKVIPRVGEDVNASCGMFVQDIK